MRGKKMRYHLRMHSPIRLALAALILLPLATVHANAVLQPTCTISLAQWESPDRTRALLGDPALRILVRAWQKQPDSHLRIDYPVGEQGALWSSRMQAWLVAFGIPRAAVRLQPGSGSDALSLSLRLAQGHA
ncbi:hypothetical protein [Acidihalobacter ferrooxydans]|uniref:Toxin co-regulated pilus biosynthesis protein Q C-terminal domain-containing protein n=1 Tax=Acidihalobacter ferrooxydans TaxID=1765967 RepID=A0A1P8UFX3_9GAMM|nr:hypothetical protein [Acidihalobacter ferrooxydans]APZ42757.1 hypothetical protein BW247_06335 [Acidihalobacter ferrooxydans]